MNEKVDHGHLKKRMESHLFYKREKYQFLFDILPFSNEQMRETAMSEPLLLFLTPFTRNYNLNNVSSFAAL